MTSSIKLVIKIAFCVFAFSCASGCKKYLDAKTNKKLVVPTTLQDAQALLDNYKQLNLTYPSIGQESDDDHYLLPDTYDALSVSEQQVYRWDVDAKNYNDWSYLYHNTLLANMALETTQKIEADAAGLNDWKFVRGQALFWRAFSFFHLVEYFAVPYDSLTASTNPGIPLRLTTDVNETIARASLEQSYQQIITDLTEAANLLPPTTVPASRPSKAAAFGLLARVYLTMNKFKYAGIYADSCLHLYSTLMDYNNLDPTASTPIKSFNPEVIFQCSTLQSYPIYSPEAKTDSLLYRSYEDSDLRKSVFFMNNADGTHSFKGSYDGTNYYDMPFNGIATDEMYLVRAECFARAGDKDKAMNDINTVLKQRWQAGAFTPLTAVSAEDAVTIALTERRKELTGRNIRWFDIRRLNAEGKYPVTLVRMENGETFKLPTHDPRFTFLIPPEVILSSGITQNSRK